MNSPHSPHSKINHYRIFCIDQFKSAFPGQDVPLHYFGPMYESEHPDAKKFNTMYENFLLTSKMNLTAYRRAVNQVDYEMYYDEITSARSSKGFLLVTINPDPKKKITWQKLNEHCKQIASAKKVRFAVWVLETTVNDHVHAHMFLSHTPDKNFVYRQLKQRLVPRVCGNNKAVNVKFIEPTMEEFKKVRDYLQKTAAAGTSKDDNNKKTLAWREVNRIPSYFTNGSVPPQLK